jgi:hypothetical protein
MEDILMATISNDQQSGSNQFEEGSLPNGTSSGEKASFLRLCLLWTARIVTIAMFAYIIIDTFPWQSLPRTEVIIEYLKSVSVTCVVLIILEGTSDGASASRANTDRPREVTRED